MKTTTSLILILGLMLTSCGILSSDTQSTTPIVFKSLFDTFETETEMNEFETIILANKAEVNTFLAQFPTDTINKERLLNVNYADSLVVGVFVGSRPNNSYSVSIDSVMVSARSSLVYISEIGSAFGGRVITWPAHFVTVGKADFNPQNAGFPYKRICLLEPCAWPVSTEPANSAL